MICRSDIDWEEELVHDEYLFGYLRCFELLTTMYFQTVKEECVKYQHMFV